MQESCSVACHAVGVSVVRAITYVNVSDNWYVVVTLSAGTQCLAPRRVYLKV